MGLMYHNKAIGLLKPLFGGKEGLSDVSKIIANRKKTNFMLVIAAKCDRMLLSYFMTK